VKSLVVMALLAHTARGGECDGFDPVLERDGVKVFNRKLDGSAVRELCATARIDAAPADVFAVLQAVETYPRIMPPTTVAERRATIGDETIYYMVIAPGFIERRDYCIAKRSGGDGKNYFVDWRAFDCPHTNVVRMVANSGSWRLSPLDGGTAVVYRTHADPGGLVPAWLVNRASARRVPDIFQSLRRALQQVSTR
jgi:hypothetical protein